MKNPGNFLKSNLFNEKTGKILKYFNGEYSQYLSKKIWKIFFNTPNISIKNPEKFSRYLAWTVRAREGYP